MSTLQILRHKLEYQLTTGEYNVPILQRRGRRKAYRKVLGYIEELEAVDRETEFEKIGISLRSLSCRVAELERPNVKTAKR